MQAPSRSPARGWLNRPPPPTSKPRPPASRATRLFARNPRPPKTMRLLFINRQSSARPITSQKKGLSRWSRRRRTTLTDPSTIEGPGALILIASCGPILSFLSLSVRPAGVGFPIKQLSRQSLRETTGVPISAAESIASQVRSAPGPRGVSGRDGAEPGREPEHGRQVPASAGGRRAERRSAPKSPRPCRGFPPPTGPRRSSAARRGFVTVGHARQMAARRLPASAGCLANANRRRALAASLTPVQTLPFWGKENSVPLTENAAAFS